MRQALPDEWLRRAPVAEEKAFFSALSALTSADAALAAASLADVPARSAASSASVLDCSADAAESFTASTKACHAGVPGFGSVPSSVPEFAATR